jgi:hypothetical protein
LEIVFKSGQVYSTASLAKVSHWPWPTASFTDLELAVQKYKLAMRTKILAINVHVMNKLIHHAFSGKSGRCFHHLPDFPETGEVESPIASPVANQSSPVSSQSGPITSQISPILSQSNPIGIDKQQIDTTTPIPEDFVDQNEDLIIRFNYVLANLQPKLRLRNKLKCQVFEYYG